MVSNEETQSTGHDADKSEEDMRTARLESVIAEQTATISALVSEIHETNRWLKILVAQKCPETPKVASVPILAPESEVQPEDDFPKIRADNNDASSIVTTGETATGDPDVPDERQNRRRETVLALWEEYFANPSDQDSLALFRDYFISSVGNAIGEGDNVVSTLDAQAMVVAEAAEFRSLQRTGAIDGRLQVSWYPVTTWSGIRSSMVPGAYNKRALEAMKGHIKKNWPTEQVGVEDIKSSLVSKWQGKGERLSRTLLCQVIPGGKLVKGTSLGWTEWDGTGDLINLGAFWMLTLEHNKVGLGLVSRLAQCVLAGLGWSSYSTERTARVILRFLHSFFVSWEILQGPLAYMHVPRKLHFHIRGYYYFCHNIRLFSPGPSRAKEADGVKRDDCQINFMCHREAGELPNLRGEQMLYFSERRLSVAFFSDKKMNSEGRRAFRIILANEGEPSSRERDMFVDWGKRGFTVDGPRAGFMMFQSVLHGMLVIWAKEWSRCLDEVDKCARVKVGQPFSGQFQRLTEICGHMQLKHVLTTETSEDLMFDDSFQKSRVYFRMLQMLRIFFDSIRETGTQLNAIIPEDTFESEYEDKAVQKNWKLVVSFHGEAEKQLLQRVLEKTEEIKSLRDGLFNATSLREASKSTTMNRYIIVFTVVTVLFLPPNFVATVFGTELFTTDDIAGTIDKFKITTIVISLFTYFTAFFLLWLADRMRIVRRLSASIRSFFARPLQGVKREKTNDMQESESSGDFDTGDTNISTGNVFRLSRPTFSFRSRGGRRKTQESEA